MSSFMIDENKNLVSDKLWEFFATPYNNSAPDINTIGKPNVGEIVIGNGDRRSSGGSMVSYVPWYIDSNSSEMYLIRKRGTSGGASGGYNSANSSTLSEVVIVAGVDGDDYLSIPATVQKLDYSSGSVLWDYFYNQTMVIIRLT